jgi:hypothetical protein
MIAMKWYYLHYSSVNRPVKLTAFTAKHYGTAYHAEGIVLKSPYILKMTVDAD